MGVVQILLVVSKIAVLKPADPLWKESSNDGFQKKSLTILVYLSFAVYY